MDRTAILVRAAALVGAVGIGLAMLEFWGTAAGIMGHYFSDEPPPRDTGLVSVQIVPAPKKPPQ